MTFSNGKIRIALVANSAWHVFNFRRNLIRRLSEEGYEIVVIAPKDDYSARFEVDFRPITLTKAGLNPIGELFSIHSLYRAYKSEQIDIALHFTPKINIYGSLAAHRLGIKCINNITGLGLSFESTGLVNIFTRKMYKFSQRFADFIFFQNDDDRKLFESMDILSNVEYDMLPGSGVDLSRFVFKELSPGKQDVFLFVGRLIRQKGVMDYIDAAAIVKETRPEAEFRIVGILEQNSSHGVSRETLMMWHQKNIVRFLGQTDEIEKQLEQASCIVLPSYYREGVPRSLLEAAAVGRPIITTDNVGCREVVDDGRNGFLCKIRDPANLAHMMLRFLDLSIDEKKQMGKESRLLAESKFNEKIVIDKYVKKIHEITKSENIGG